MNANPLHLIRSWRQLRDAEAFDEIAQLKSVGGRLVQVRQVTQRAMTGTKAIVDTRDWTSSDSWFPHRNVMNGWLYSAQSIERGHGPHTSQKILYIEGVSAGVPPQTVLAAQRHEERTLAAKVTSKDKLFVPPEWTGETAPPAEPQTSPAPLPAPGWTQRFYTNWWQGRKSKGWVLLRPYIPGLRALPRGLRLTWPTQIVFWASLFGWDQLIAASYTAKVNAIFPGFDTVPAAQIPPAIKTEVAWLAFHTLLQTYLIAAAAGVLSWLLILLLTRGWEKSYTCPATQITAGLCIKVPGRVLQADRVMWVEPRDGAVMLHLRGHGPTTVKAKKRVKTIALTVGG